MLKFRWYFLLLHAGNIDFVDGLRHYSYVGSDRRGGCCASSLLVRRVGSKRRVLRIVIARTSHRNIEISVRSFRRIEEEGFAHRHGLVLVIIKMQDQDPST